MVKEDSDKKEERRKITDKAYSIAMEKRDELEKQGRFSLLGHAMNAFRRENDQYLPPDGEYKKIPDSKYNSGEKEVYRLARRLDPAGRYFEDSGDSVAAKESRIAQAQKLTQNGNKNYYSAGILYETAEKPIEAIANYKLALKGEDLSEDTRERINQRIIELESPKRKSSKGLIAKLSIISVLGGTLFVSYNITGNTISNLSSIASSFIGSALLTLGIMAGFFWVKLRRK